MLPQSSAIEQSIVQENPSQPEVASPREMQGAVSHSKVATELDIRKIMEELTRLSRPNGSVHSRYLRVLAESQVQYWRAHEIDGNADAAFLIRFVADDSEGCTQVDRLRPLAERGHIWSLWLVGDELSGDYKNPLYSVGIQMLLKASKAGFEFAEYSYAWNLDCDSDDERRWDRMMFERHERFAALAKRKYPPAMNRVGQSMIDNAYKARNEERQIREAFQLLKDAAKFGCEDAASHLSYEYEKGRNVPMSMTESQHWKLVSSELSDARDYVPVEAYGIKTLLAEDAISDSKRALYLKDQG